MVLAGSIRAWELLGETEHLIDHELESRDPQDSAWIQELKDEIGLERARTFAHDKLLELERERKETYTELNLDDLVIPESIKTDEAEAGQ